MEIIKDQVSVLYGKIYKQNMRLLKKSENKGVVIDCAEVFDFYTTSHALSFLKDILLPMYRISRSMSRAGTPTDNAAMESINGWAKEEMFTDLHITGERPVAEEIDAYMVFFNE